MGKYKGYEMKRRCFEGMLYVDIIRGKRLYTRVNTKDEAKRWIDEKAQKRHNPGCDSVGAAGPALHS